MNGSTDTPTVVLVHGGFVIRRTGSRWLRTCRRTICRVWPYPLRGRAHDAEYIASFVNQIDGPVLLVGHS